MVRINQRAHPVVSSPRSQQHGLLRRGETISRSQITQFSEAWAIDAEYRRLSRRTIESRRDAISKLLWWPGHNGIEAIGPDEIRSFISYVADAHPEGRWGHGGDTGAKKPGTAATYFSRLRTFFRYLVTEGYANINPMQSVRAPINRADQITPFTESHVQDLLVASKRSDLPARNESILLFLLDTGVRSSELCTLTRRDLDLPSRKAVVQGKGDRRRAVYFSPTTAKAITRYFRSLGTATPRSTGAPLDLLPQSPVFLSEREVEPGIKGRLTPNGLGQLVQRLGREAGIRGGGVRCSPHTFRHTAAVMFLRAGGHVFALKEMLGHTTLAMTNRYALLAQADVQAQHAQFSPVDRLKRTR